MQRKCRVTPSAAVSVTDTYTPLLSLSSPLFISQSFPFSSLCLPPLSHLSLSLPVLAPMTSLWTQDPHYDLSRRQLKWLRTGQSFGAKRGPGRPRKNPLASPLVAPFLSPTSQPNPPTETDVKNRDRNRGRGGGDSVQEVIEAVIQSQRRRRRKRRHIEKEEVEHPSCLQR